MIMVNHHTSPSYCLPGSTLNDQCLNGWPSIALNTPLNDVVPTWRIIPVSK